MPKVSIGCLIYRSTVYADFVWENVHKYTPELSTSEAEFYFVANDATPEVIEHLKEKGYTFYIQNNPHRTNDELFALGFGKPEYLHRVYRGWNRAIDEARGEIVVLVNSDMGFSPNWLANILKHVSGKKVVSSRLVERGHPVIGHFTSCVNGTGSVVYQCGRTPLEFEDEKFQAYVEKHSKPNKVSGGGVFMPVAFFKDTVVSMGKYPEGNLAGKDFDHPVASGDDFLFRKMKESGIEHITSWDSMVYHFQQGEMEFVNETL